MWSDQIILYKIESSLFPVNFQADDFIKYFDLSKFKYKLVNYLPGSYEVIYLYLLRYQIIGYNIIQRI